MADALQRWNGTEWVTVASVNHIGGGGSQLKVLNGITEPTEKYGVWFKTEEKINKVSVEAFLQDMDDSWDFANPIINVDDGRGITAVAGIDKIYAFGGNGTLDRPRTRIYDTATGVWSMGTDMIFGDRYAAGIRINDKIYVFGGSNNNYITRIYDIMTGTWNTGTSSAYIIGQSGICEHNDKIYIFGGAVTTTNSKTKIYDIATDTWTLGIDMIFADLGWAAKARNNFYVCGGDTNKDKTRIYNPTTGNWGLGSPMIYGDLYVAIASINSNVYVIGGDVNTNVTRVYNADTDVWSVSIQPLNAVRMAVATSANNILYVICGANDRTSVRRLSFKLFDYATGTALIIPGGTGHNTKLLDNISLYISEAWIVKDGKLINYETYIGDGTQWNLFKEASI